MDKTIQSLVSKFIAPPLLKRRIPTIVNGLLPTFIAGGRSNEKVLDGLHTIVHSLSSQQSTVTSHTIQDMIEKAGGRIMCDRNSVQAIVCDSRGIRSPNELSLLHSMLQPTIKKIPKNGRIVVIGNDYQHTGTKDAVAAATTAGIQGFVKSLSKEMAGKGITTNMIMVPSNLNDLQLSGPLNFFLSSRSSFITGQTLRLSSNMNNNIFENNTCGRESAPLFSVKGKRVVLTGASRGIGAFTAKLLHSEGAHLLLVDHPSMEKQLKEFSDQMTNCSYLSLDITESDADKVLQQAIEACFADVASSCGASAALVDTFIHNAGITRDKSFKNMKSDAFNSVIDVNLTSVIKLDNMLFSSSLVKPGSNIVYLSSISGVAGTFGQTNYSCSKAGIIGYVQSLGSDVDRHGVGINAIAPGFIETEMTDKIPLLTRIMGRHINSLKQGGYPADVAEAVVFLSSNAADAVHGNTLRVCGHHIIG